MLGWTAPSLSDLTSKHIHQIWDRPTDHTQKKVSKKELGCPPDQPERTTKRHVLICVCWTCLSHTRTGRGPCFPSSLPFSYTDVFQPIPPHHHIQHIPLGRRLLLRLLWQMHTVMCMQTHTHTHTRSMDPGGKSMPRRPCFSSYGVVVREMVRQFYLRAPAANDIFRPSYAPAVFTTTCSG